VKVNDDPGAAGQGNPAIATDRLGNAVAVWKDLRTGNNALAFAFLPSFVRQWSENALIPNTQLPGTLGNPAVAIGARGEVIVVWNDDRDGEYDIYVSRRLPGGSAWSAPERINDEPPVPVPQRNPDVAVGPDGTVYVVWEDDRGGAPPDIFWSQNKSGTPGWRPSARVNTDAAGIQAQPALTVDGDGNVYVAWMDRRGSQMAILVAQLPAGSTAWSAPTVAGGSFPAGSNPNAPDVAVDGANAVHVVWEDSRDAAHNVDIYHSLRRSGSAAWTASTRINDDSGSALQHAPRLAAKGGNVVAVWEDGRRGDPDIFLAWWLFGSNLWTVNRRVNDDASAAGQVQPDVALDRTGNAYVIWTDSRAPSGPDIFFRFVSATERFRLYLPMVIK